MFESRPHCIILQTAKVVPTSDMSINTKTRHLAMIGLTDKDLTIKELLIVASCKSHETYSFSFHAIMLKLWTF